MLQYGEPRKYRVKKNKSPIKALHKRTTRKSGYHSAVQHLTGIPGFNLWHHFFSLGPERKYRGVKVLVLNQANHSLILSTAPDYQSTARGHI